MFLVLAIRPKVSIRSRCWVVGNQRGSEMSDQQAADTDSTAAPSGPVPSKSEKQPDARPAKEGFRTESMLKGESLGEGDKKG